MKWRVMPNPFEKRDLAIFCDHEQKLIASVPKSQQDNAKLIAAAPELVECLRALVTWHEKWKGRIATPSDQYLTTYAAAQCSGEKSAALEQARALLQRIEE